MCFQRLRFVNSWTTLFIQICVRTALTIITTMVMVPIQILAMALASGSSYVSDADYDPGKRQDSISSDPDLVSRISLLACSPLTVSIIVYVAVSITVIKLIVINARNRGNIIPDAI